MSDDNSLRKIFDGMFRPIFERQPELGINDLRKAFQNASFDTLMHFMQQFHRLELVTCTTPFHWKLLRKDN